MPRLLSAARRHDLGVRPPAVVAGMTQLSLDPILTHGCGRVQFFCGYAYGAPIVDGFTHGIVSTPRYIPRLLQETDLPVVLDNGAYPAFRDGVDLPYHRQRGSIREALSLIDDRRLLWAVLPDVVADADESFRRALKALIELAVPPSKWLLPVQEGAPFDEYARFIEFYELGGAFVGGATKAFKWEATKALSGRVPWLHVARVCRDAELHRITWLGADSFDSTTPTRAFTHHQTAGRDRDWHTSFSRYCVPTC